MTWLLNAALKVHADCGSRRGLVVNLAMLVPTERTVYYVHLTFAERGTLVISLDGTTALGAAPAVLRSRSAVEEQLRTEFGIGDITRDDVDWQVSELVQVCDAFTLVPMQDRLLLEDCRLVRRTAPRPGSVGHIELGDCGVYFPDTNTLVLFDSAFADPDHGFVGFRGQRRPRSHRTILHLVGHVVGLRTPRWLALLPDSGVSSPGDLPFVLARFRLLVAELGLKPITPDSEAVWETQPLEFFADAYALALTEPGVLGWVSERLREWILQGGYRSL